MPAKTETEMSGFKALTLGLFRKVGALRQLNIYTCVCAHAILLTLFLMSGLSNLELNIDNPDDG